MPPESVSEADRTCPDCGYVVKQKDMMFVTNQGIWHTLCYECGREWIV